MSEKFAEFFQGKGYYGVMASTIVLPGLTTYFAYREAMNKLYYLNIFIGLVLFVGGVFVYYQYKTFLKHIEKAAVEIMSGFEYSEEQKQATLKQIRENAESTLGLRCQLFSIIGGFIGLCVLIWSARKLMQVKQQ